MLGDLNYPQEELANYMSQLSEEAYCAGWMDGLEFELWRGMNKEISDYGRLKFTDEMVNILKALSNQANGWIIYDDKEEEKFVGFEEWQEIFKNRSI